MLKDFILMQTIVWAEMWGHSTYIEPTGDRDVLK